MKRGIKSLLLVLGAFWILACPKDVWAAEYKLGKAEKDANVTKIEIKINIAEGEQINQAQLTCSTDHSDVDCAIEVSEGSGFTANASSSGLVFISYINNDDPADTNFPTGETILAKAVLTNSSSNALSNVQVKLDGSTIGGSEVGSVSTHASLGAKPEDKTLSKDATLKSLKVSQGKMSPEFKTDVYNYTIYDIADTINSVKITYECNAPADEGQCTDSISGGKSVSGNTVTLNQGENIVKVEITSPEGIDKVTYTLKIIRGESAYNSDKLSSLKIGDYTLSPAFSSDVISYNLTIPNTIDSIKDILEYTPVDENAKVDVQGAENLIVGLNRVTLKVDNVNGDSSKTYVINVTRLSEENIEIVNYKNNIVTYKDENGIETKLEMTEFEKQYPSEATKIKDGLYKFDEEGNIVIENTNTTVTEEPKAEEEKKDNKVWLIVVLVIVGLAIIIGSGILIFHKKDKKEETSDAKEENIEKHEEKASTESDDANYNEDGIEEAVIGGEFSDDLDTTVDVDIALNDLMNTKQYEFDDEDR